jgi:hypothetical protein
VLALTERLDTWLDCDLDTSRDLLGKLVVGAAIEEVQRPEMSRSGLGPCRIKWLHGGSN